MRVSFALALAVLASCSAPRSPPTSAVRCAPEEPDVATTSSLALGHACLCATSAGRLGCWGRCPIVEPEADDTEVAQVSVSGGDDVCLLRADGVVVCYGRYREAGAHPFQAPVARRFPIALPEPARYVSTRSHTQACAVLSSGRVRCWSMDESDANGRPRRVGPGAAEEIALPAPAVIVELGGQTACALTESGAVYCWGRVWSSSEAREVRTPARLSGLPDLVTLSVGPTGAACGTDARGAAWCSGPDTLIHGIPSDARVRRRSDVLDVAQIRLGERGCARLRCGRVSCWGASPHPKIADPVDAIDGGQSLFAPVCVLAARGVRCFGRPSRGTDERPLATLEGRWTSFPAP